MQNSVVAAVKFAMKYLEIYWVPRDDVLLLAAGQGP